MLIIVDKKMTVLIRSMNMLPAKFCTTTHLLAQQPLLGLSGSLRLHQGLHGAIHLQRLVFLTEHLLRREFLLKKYVIHVLI